MHCLQCIKNVKGDTITRPLVTQILTEFPVEILMFDFIKIGPSDDGYIYVLMGVGKFTNPVESVPCEVISAIPTSKSITDWGGRFGLPS